MSHIDSFKHELVGLIGGLPVYHPLQSINGDFESGVNQLIIGGGSGEHPALIIKNPLSTVACFLENHIESLEDNALFKDDFSNAAKKWKSIIKKYVNWQVDYHFHFSGWSVSNYKHFYDLLTGSGIPNPYDEDSDRSFESWLILGIGEFTFFAMPKLASEIMTQLDDPYKYFHSILFNNILLIPPNMPVYANGGNAFKHIHNPLIS
jgi:hypothetical protein